MKPIKAISLWQPWATLVVVGAKSFETRSWATHYRGRLAIHAGKRWEKDQRDLWEEDFFRQALFEAGYHPETNPLPLGAYVGEVTVGEMYRTDGVPIAQISVPIRDLHFGDFSPGRYAWQLLEPQRYPEPIPGRGFQGLYNWRRS